MNTKFKFKNVPLEIGERWVYISITGIGSEIAEIVDIGRLESENSYHPIVKCVQVLVPYIGVSTLGITWESNTLGTTVNWVKLEGQNCP
jgi:hypothetical protein